MPGRQETGRDGRVAERHGHVLFTDIEGSTGCWSGWGAGYREVLGEHRRLLRAAFAQFDGREVGSEGDSFFVAFARASDAVAAAQGQRALAGHRWPDGVVLRVRMGMHTGEPVTDPDGYAGPAVHRAARICAAGHGGQVLCSQMTRALLGAELPAEDFPALRTLGSRPANLPVPQNRFVSRARAGQVA